MAHLYVVPEVLRYGPGEAHLVQAALDRQESNTQLVDVDANPEAILLHPNGRTMHGDNRLQVSVFRKICKTVSFNLAPVLNDLAGDIIKRKLLPQQCYSPEDAAAVFNAFVRLRGRDALAGYTVLRDMEANTLDGIYSAGYQRLPHGDFFAQACGHAEDLGFHLESAVLAGRWFSFHMVKDEEAAKVGDDVYRPGLYYGNSEVGDDAARATYTAVRQDGLRVLAPFGRHGRVYHRGRTFLARLNRLLSRVVDRAVNYAWLKEHLSRMADVSLGFLGNDDPTDEQLFFRLQNLLRIIGYESSEARSLLRGCLRQGASQKQPNLMVVKEIEWPTRSVYDLFVAAMRAPVRCAIPLRERLEQTAFKTLGGRISLVDLLLRSRPAT